MIGRVGSFVLEFAQQTQRYLKNPKRLKATAS